MIIHPKKFLVMAYALVTCFNILASQSNEKQSELRRRKCTYLANAAANGAMAGLLLGSTVASGALALFPAQHCNQKIESHSMAYDMANNGACALEIVTAGVCLGVCICCGCASACLVPRFCKQARWNYKQAFDAKKDQ